jgi:hypothetical protein
VPTSIANGTQTAVIGTEHTLATDTTNKTYVLAVDCGALVGGATPDIVELRIYTINLSAGTERLAYYAHAVGGQQTELIKYSPPVPARISCKATLKQVQGTGRAFPWDLMSL